MGCIILKSLGKYALSLIDLIVVLWWENVFVANRVECIKQSTESTQWKYVASEENPTDHTSRGFTAEQLLSSNWLTSPGFLWQKELPRGEVKVGEVSSSDPELKKVQVHDIQAKETKSLLDRLHKFSNWSRMVKAISRLKRHVKETKGLQPRSWEATSLEERREAELTIIKMVQEATFSKEIQCLQSHKETQVKDKADKLNRLSPFLDDQGILRVGGRIPMLLYIHMLSIQWCFQEIVTCQHYSSSTIMRECSIRDGEWP